jgi:hypothetical protein
MEEKKEEKNKIIKSRFTNNNPGNIRVDGKNNWLGMVNGNEVGSFAKFVTEEYGLRALVLNIYNSLKLGNDTIEKLITRYAPRLNEKGKVENDTEAYIRDVSRWMCWDRSRKIGATKIMLSDLTKSICRKEQSQMISNGEFLQALNLTKLKI